MSEWRYQNWANVGPAYIAVGESFIAALNLVLKLAPLSTPSEEIKKNMVAAR